MRHHIVTASFFAIVVISALSCEKNQEPELQKANGIVLNYGDPAVDGCGWMIKINNNIYSPKILDTNFQKDNMRVTINYHVLDSTWNCGWREPGYKIIEIFEICETL